jgi:hypothetical protein
MSLDFRYRNTLVSFYQRDRFAVYNFPRTHRQTIYRGATTEIEKLALRSPECTDQTREVIAKRAIDRALDNDLCI